MSKQYQTAHSAHSKASRLTSRATGQVPEYRTKYSYDALGQVISGRRFWQDGTPVAGQQFDYAFDTIGNRKSASMGGDSTGANLRTADYTTDRLNRYSQRTVQGYADILGIANPNNSVTVNGNTAYRKGEYFHYALPIANSSVAQYPLVTVASTYPPGQQDSGNFFLPRTPEQFGYDADGNLTSDGRWNYTWDAENRLVRLESFSAAPDDSKRLLEFAYDYQSRRIQKSVSTWNPSTLNYQLSTRTKFVYDGWNLLGEIDALNPQPSTLIRSYIWGSDLSGSMQGAGGVGGLLMVWDFSTINSQPSTHFVAYDGNGNVASLFNSQGATASATYEYGPFGELIRSTGPMAKANPFRFSTKYQDDESYLLYYGYRYYSPSTGRWLSRDPVGEEAGRNLVAFVGNACLSTCDVLGLAGRDCAGKPSCIMTCRWRALAANRIIGTGGDWWLHQIGKLPLVPNFPAIQVGWDNICAGDEWLAEFRTMARPTPGSSPIAVSADSGVMSVESRWWLPAWMGGYGGNDQGAMSNATGRFCCCRAFDWIVN